MTDRETLAPGTHSEYLRDCCLQTGLAELAECANEIDRLQAECERWSNLWKLVEDECWDLRCTSHPIGITGDSYNYWEVIEHHMSPPRKRVVGTGPTPIDAFNEARAALNSQREG